ncbi:putative transmembrane protein [Rhodopirellula islandica]|uniref:Transmembrane protein n=1 Tax=Rhodopirellula islandica TaxID=595434 RepID=A0A0J1BLP0_RHOIS|nr:hypothetical protein [Rhodopirellula islandica]KLU07426.1 putative transmembrane protein [Rhodopirellula islandica]
MASAKAVPSEKRTAWIKWACSAVVVLGLLLFFYPREKVELNDQGYDASVALYRICNQKDGTSLQKVADQIVQWRSDGTLSEQSHSSLQRVIELASAGDWRQASRECRQMMEDQVQR